MSVSEQVKEYINSATPSEVANSVHDYLKEENSQK